MLTKVIFVKDAELFAYEFDGLLGEFMDGIRKNIETGKLNPENITSIVSNIGQEGDEDSDRMTIVRFMAGDPHVALSMIAEAIATYANRADRPEVLCGLVCDSAMKKCSTFDTQDSSRIVVPDKRIVH